ncbi:MAG TPA: O-antigen ligase family protein [Terriglobales bacterium]|jgi:O-antigen ligase
MTFEALFPDSWPIRSALSELAAAPIKLIHFWIELPLLMFLSTLAAMLFRPPDLKTVPIDRVAFVVLVAVLLVRICLHKLRFQLYPASWPLLGLALLGLWGAVTQPYSPQAWSLFAAKWMVPLVFFHAAALLFQEQASLQKLETFLLIILCYLTAISILWLFGWKQFIFPRFITDESIGIHADRARGPFLQAVANGVSINLLAVIALDSFRRGRLRGILAWGLLTAVPLALLATKTRAVWISAALSIIWLVFFGSARKRRRVAFGVCLVSIITGGILFVYRNGSEMFADRLVDRSPVDFRTEMYSAGLQMFTEKPLLGWGNEWDVQPEIEKRVSSFHPDYYIFHNTFLELAVQRGVLGLGLYVWLMICLLKLPKNNTHCTEQDVAFCSPHFLKLWPLLLLIYVVNASAVVMNYQFVNALLFTIAGILAAQGHHFREVPSETGRSVS